MSMKKIRLTMAIALPLLAVSFFPSTSRAQAQPGDRPERGERQGQRQGQRGGQMIDRLHEMVTGLKLTDEQKPKIEEIFTKAREDARKLMEESRDMEPQERGQKMREFNTALQDEIKSVLDDAQKKEFDQKLSEMRPGRGQGQGAGPGGGQGQGQGVGQLGRRFRDAMAKIELTEEQKPKVDAILTDLDKKVTAMREETQGDVQAMREKGRLIAQDTTEQLRAVLTPEQQEKLRDEMQGGRREGQDGQGGNRRRGGAGPNDPAPPSDPPPPPPDPDKPKGSALAPPDMPDRLAIGQPAPDFAATKLDGSTVRLSSFKGQLVLLAFGSYSSPSFRQRAAGLDAIRRDNSTRVNVIFVYTREAHPAGAWDVSRNIDEKISIADHKDFAQRRDAARLAQKQLSLKTTVLLDSMENEVAQAYGAWPNNAAVLIGKDGEVLAYQKWFDAYAMRDAVTAARNPRK